MPKSKKPKATVPHRMVLRSRGTRQPVSYAGPPHVPAASSNSLLAGAVINAVDHVIHPPPSLSHVANHGPSTPSAPLSASTPTAVTELDAELQDTQVLGSGTHFAEGIIANLGNVDPTPANPDAPSTQRISRVSRLRRAFAQLGDLDSPSSANEGQASQAIIQVVASLPFSQSAVDGLANIHPSGSIAEEPETQVVGAQAPFSGGLLRSLANVPSVQASAEVATQAVASGRELSERIVGELANVDLAQIVVASPAVTDYDWDEGATIRTFSQATRPETPLAREVDAAPSNHTAVKSWASGSLTTSMREYIGMPPKPLKNGKVRPVPEDLGTPPPRWPCVVKVNHPTCGHTYKTVVHSHVCYYFEDKNPGERVYRNPIMEQEVLDEWGLPPSAQQPGGTQGTTLSKTQVITEEDEECYESTSSIVLTGKLCEGCRAEQVGQA